MGLKCKFDLDLRLNQNGIDMSYILLCGERSVEIIIGVKMTCQTCLYAQQVTPTSQLSFQGPLKDFRNAQQRELNKKKGAPFVLYFILKSRSETLMQIALTYRVIFLTGPPLKMSLDWPPQKTP